MKVDFRFIEIEHELMVLSEYLKLVETNLPSILNAEISRIRREFDYEDGLSRDEGFFMEELLEEGVTTRFLTAALVLASWAVYESAVQTLAQYIASQRKVSLRMSDLRGDFPTRARKYFGDVLRFPLHPSDADWQRIARIGQLRDALAHTNGLLPYLRQDARRRLEPWIKQTKGLDIAGNVGNECLVVSLDFAGETLMFLDQLVRDLINRVRAEVRSAPK